MNKFFHLFLAMIMWTSSQAQIAKNSMKQANKVLNNLVSHHKTPAVQYIIFDQKSILHQVSLGCTDLKNKEKATEQTTFNAFSITKTFTALAVLQLVEKGTFKLDDAVQKHWPGFPYGGEITIKQLLNHTAGIPSPIPLNWVHLKETHRQFDRNSFFKDLFQKKVKSKPNEKFRYSNLGYVLLGQLIEEVTHKSYEKVIQQNIIKPLGLNPAFGSEQMGFELGEHHATGYQKRRSFSNLLLGLFIKKSKYMSKPIGRWKPFKEYYVNGPSYGGLISTPKALMVYLQEFLKDKNQLLSPTYEQILFTENHTNNNRATGMCLAWFKGELNGHTFYTHAGGGGGFYCEIRIYPDLGLGSVIMFNRTGMSDERILDDIDCFFMP